MTLSVESAPVTRGRAVVWPVLVGVAVLAGATAAALAALSIADALTATGLPDPGPVTTLGLPFVRAAGEIAAVLAVGSFMFAAFFVPPQESGVLDAAGYRALRMGTAAAGVWALHLVLLARWSKPEHALQLARIQTATVAVLALVTVGIGGWLTGGSVLPRIPPESETWLSVVFLAVLATAAAMILLSWAQSRLTATRAAVILTLEPAAAGITGALLGSEFGGRTIAGGALLLAAMVMVELGSMSRFTKRPARHRAPPTWSGAGSRCAGRTSQDDRLVGPPGVAR